jgi:hypothetical protein
MKLLTTITAAALSLFIGARIASAELKSPTAISAEPLAISAEQVAAATEMLGLELPAQDQQTIETAQVGPSSDLDDESPAPESFACMKGGLLDCQVCMCHADGTITDCKPLLAGGISCLVTAVVQLITLS